MTSEAPRLRRTGCAWSILAINTVVIGLAALSFSQGPYSSPEQELWYRYGSLGFLLVGAILPAIALLLGARSSTWGTVALTMWMVAGFVSFMLYAILSGGGV